MARLMSFSFGFFDGGGGSPSRPSESVDQVASSEDAPLSTHLCHDIPSPPADTMSQMEFIETSIADVIIYRRKLDCIGESDLVPGVYEGGYEYMTNLMIMLIDSFTGGLRLWECSIDLTRYILSTPEIAPANSSSAAMELGCGHGFPGIAALIKRFPVVIFTDFNENVSSISEIIHKLRCFQVLFDVTWPNIIRNITSFKNKSKCFSGDWMSFSSQLSTKMIDDAPLKYELILSDETLYNIESCKKVSVHLIIVLIS